MVNKLINSYLMWMKPCYSENGFIPELTFLRKKLNPDFKFRIAKHLLGDSTEGNFKLKLMLVYRSLNSYSVKDYKHRSRLIIWRSNKKQGYSVTGFELFLPSF
jgi:hypothetical protein